MSKSDLKIAVFGAGAVGAYFGGRLAEAGVDVHFIARGATLDAIRAHGLRITSIAGDFSVKVPVTENPAEIGPVDAVIVGVKAWQLEEVARAMQPMLKPGTAVIPLQNGVEAPGVLSEVLGAQHVLGGLCQIAAQIEAPGWIRHLGADPTIRFGELDNTRSSRVEALKAAFDDAKGVQAEIPDDISVALWRKFMLICPWSGLGAVTRAPAGAFRTEPRTRALLTAMLDEIAAVGRASGVALPDDAAAVTLGYFDSAPPGVTASMQRDIMDGLPSELDVQSGAVARLGKALGVPTPVNAFVYAALLPMERRARKETDWSI